MAAHSFPPDAFAGVELHVYNLARFLGERHEVHVLHRVQDESAPEYSISFSEYKGVSTIRLVNNMTYQHQEEMEIVPGVREAFGRVLDMIKPDVTHFHHLILLSADLPEESRAREIPSVASLHDYWYLCNRVQLYAPGKGRCQGPGVFRCPHCFDLNDPLVSSMNRMAFLGDWWACRWMRFFRHVPWPWVYTLYQRRFERMRRTLSSYDLLVANSNYLKQRFVKFGVQPRKIVVVNPGLDHSLLRSYRHEPSADVRFGYVGSIIEHKGLHIMMEAFRRVPEASLQVWGDREINPVVREYATSLNPPSNVRFMGAFDNRVIGRVLSGIDVLVVPPLWDEAYGLTVDEAKVAGVPVIASRIGGIPEHLEDGKEGFLFTPGSTDELERMIRRLAGRPDLVEKLQPAGDDVPTLYENAMDMEEYYRQVIHRADHG